MMYIKGNEILKKKTKQQSETREEWENLMWARRRERKTTELKKRVVRKRGNKKMEREKSTENAEKEGYVKGKDEKKR
jgi:hypothetical protein